MQLQAFIQANYSVVESVVDENNLQIYLNASRF